MTKYYTAQEAADLLGIKANTLYAYVSRGLIRSEEDTSVKSRARRYMAADVERLRERREARRNPKSVAPKALDWGEPVLPTAVTLIKEGQLYYRGYQATALADTRSFADVCSLLWLDDLEGAADIFSADVVSRVGDMWQEIALPHSPNTDRNPLEAFQLVLSLLAPSDLFAYLVPFDPVPRQVASIGANILLLLTAVLTQSAPSKAPIAVQLAQAWMPQGDVAEATHLLNAALILCADHGLNASSFAARVTASTRATLYAVVQTGLATLSGTKHGGQTELIGKWLHELQQVGVHQALADWVKRGERVPGFGHQLYPDGDPRGRFLLQAVMKQYSDTAVVQDIQATLDILKASSHPHPTLDLGLVAVARALKLPPAAPLAIFALGRTVGWLAQAQEQYQLDQLIRPRARYTGRQPTPAMPEANAT